MMKKIFLLCLFVLINTQYSFAVNKKSFLIVRGDGEYPPNEFMENGELVGFHIDILKMVMNRLHWSYRLESYPWERAVHMVENGDADGITYFGKNPEREKYTWYNNAVLSRIPFCFWILTKDRLKYNFNGDVNAFAKQVSSLGIIKGYSYDKVILSAGFKFEESKNEEASIKKLQ